MSENPERVVYVRAKDLHGLLEAAAMIGRRRVRDAAGLLTMPKDNLPELAADAGGHIRRAPMLAQQAEWEADLLALLSKIAGANVERLPEES